MAQLDKKVNGLNENLKNKKLCQSLDRAFY
jgi:hypothetical protein